MKAFWSFIKENENDPADNVEWNIDDSYIKKHYKEIKDDMVIGLADNVENTSLLYDNIQMVASDLQTGDFLKTSSLKNLSNVLLDIAKITGQTALFILPGGSLGLVGLKKLLKTEGSKKLGIDKLLDLSVEAIKQVEDAQH
jgi:hypothetical protein